MVTISLSLDESLLHQLLGEAHAESFSLNEKIVSLLTRRVLAPSTRAALSKEELLDLGIPRVAAMKAGEMFALEQLFEREWDQIPSRRVFGRMFRQRVESEGLARVDHKTASNHAVYVRVES